MQKEIEFEEFYDKYHDYFLNVCQFVYSINYHDSEDIIQNTFMELLKKWCSFSTHTEKGLFIWTSKTVKYMSYSFNRKKNKTPIILDFQDWYISDQSLPCYYLVARDENQLFLSYIKNIRNMLSEKELLIFDCIMIGQTPPIIAAEHLKINLNTLKKRLKKLRKKLNDDILPTIIEP